MRPNRVLTNNQSQSQITQSQITRENLRSKKRQLNTESQSKQSLEYEAIKEKIESDVLTHLESQISDQISDQINVAFDKKLKSTAQQLSATIVDSVHKTLLDSCHDLIHEHMDKFDVTIPVDRFKTIIREVLLENEQQTDKKSNPKSNQKNNQTPTKPNDAKKLVIKNLTRQPQRTGIALNQMMEMLGCDECGECDGIYPEKYPEKDADKFFAATNDPIIKKLLALQTTLENKQAIYRMYVGNMKSPGKCDKKVQKWLEWALDMPYDKLVEYPITKADSNSKIHKFLYQMRAKLDATVHGMNEAKEEIMLEVMKRMMNPESTGKIIVLEGAPGIGKTYLSRSISDGIGIPFESIALGSCRDSAILTGHDFTYVGSQPGLIARSLKKMACSNGNLYLDEMDKIGQTDKSREVTSTLLSILDETQNSSFSDSYLTDIKINLSRVLVTGSVNDANGIDPILRNRCKIIKLPAPTLDDKVIIARQYFFPDYMRALEIPQEELQYNDAIIKYLISKTKSEPGVRELKRAVEHIVSRFNMLRKTYLNHVIKTKVTLNPSLNPSINQNKKRKVVKSSKNESHQNESHQNELSNNEQPQNEPPQNESSQNDLKYEISKYGKAEVVPVGEKLMFSFSFPEFKIPLQLTEAVIDIFMKKSEMGIEEIDPSVKRMYM